MLLTSSFSSSSCRSHSLVRDKHALREALGQATADADARAHKCDQLAAALRSLERERELQQQKALEESEQHIAAADMRLLQARADLEESLAPDGSTTTAVGPACIGVRGGSWRLEACRVRAGRRADVVRAGKSASVGGPPPPSAPFFLVCVALLSGFVSA